MLANNASVNRWAGIDCSIRLDPRWLETDNDRVRLASILRLLVAKETGRFVMHRLAWRQLLGEYGDDEVVNGLLTAGYLEVGDEPDTLGLPIEEWQRLCDLRSDPSAAERQRRARQRRGNGAAAPLVAVTREDF